MAVVQGLTAQGYLADTVDPVMQTIRSRTSPYGSVTEGALVHGLDLSAAVEVRA